MGRSTLVALAVVAAGCGGGVPDGDDAGAGGGDAAVAGDLAVDPCAKCGGLTAKCNAAKHCVGCVADGDCPMGSYCKIVSDTMASCVPGCAGDGNCGSGQKCCGGRCVDTSSDPANCGGCAMPCAGVHERASCNAGQCAPGTCDEGWGDCNMDPKDGCESNLHADPMNCTMCGMACNVANAYVGCADGCYTAACKFGYDDCNNNAMDGCETSVLSDPKNCGACGKSCTMLANAQAGCTSGNCVLSSCSAGYADCDGMPGNGCEVAVGTDVNNCGTCGNVCPQGNVCKGGGCTCPMCNIPNASAKCVNNMCVFDKCNPGFADCNNNVADGCEVNLSQDKNNCGQCGTVCPMNLPYCAMGMCNAACLMGKGPPNACDGGTDPQSGAKWVVCKADCNSAWLSHGAPGGGNFHALEICQSLGYSQLSCWDGTYNNVCGFQNDAGSSCMKTGMQSCARAANQPNCGMDQFGGIFCNTVQWTCLK